MTLEHLWAGWRGEYVAGVASGPAALEPSDCVFCGILAIGLPDEDTHIVRRHPSGLVITILNLYPYASGHLMVMPNRHVGDLEALTAAESAALWATVAEAVVALKAVYRPDGLNVGANIGRAAGAGVPGHFHVHVVPRWGGDTNFMTTIAGARVLPETLAHTGTRLRAAWPAPASGS